MTRQFRIVYDLSGFRGAIFICTLTQAGAQSLFRAHFPAARIVCVSEVTS